MRHVVEVREHASLSRFPDGDEGRRGFALPASPSLPCASSRSTTASRRMHAQRSQRDGQTEGRRVAFVSQIALDDLSTPWRASAPARPCSLSGFACQERRSREPAPCNAPRDRAAVAGHSVMMRIVGLFATWVTLFLVICLFINTGACLLRRILRPVASATGQPARGVAIDDRSGPQHSQKRASGSPLG